MADQMKPLKLVVTQQVEALRNSVANDSDRSLAAAKANETDQRAQLAIVHTQALIGGFRKCEADDPELYFRTIEHVLARYDVEIQKEVTRPGRWKFPPTAYELREACEALANERARAREREDRIAAQLAERRAADAPQTARKPQDIPVRLTRDELEGQRAEEFLARCKAEAEAAARPAAAPSVFELDPADWNA